MGRYQDSGTKELEDVFSNCHDETCAVLRLPLHDLGKHRAVWEAGADEMEHNSMTGSPDRDLAARVEKLERENRLCKSAASLLCAGFGALLVMAPTGNRRYQPSPIAAAEEIRAKRFVMVDDTGKVRATLDTQNLGWPHLSRAGLTVYSSDTTRKAVISSDSLMNQVTVENNTVGSGSRYARMQVGTDGVGLELSEFFLSSSSHNLFGVHWASAKQGTPTLEISKSAPHASVHITPGSPPAIGRTR